MTTSETPQRAPRNLECVIAIQGGGIYALPMLGQVRAVLEAGYVPLGFAGNSGGAILAALLWSGLTPDRIEEIFRESLASNPRELTNLLLPLDGTGLSLEDLRDQLKRGADLLPLPQGPFKLLRHLVRHAKTIWRLRKTATTIWRERGIFPGDRLAQFIDLSIREGLGFEAGQHRLTFAEARKAGRRPPLLLTATNVSTGQLFLIDSTDPRYDKIRIADAVRASAGFPMFFRPIDLEGAGAGRCFVDGGMISNFPLWAFSRTFRAKLQGSNTYGWLAPRPWVPIGIRVHDEAGFLDTTSPSVFVQRLFAIASGMARDDLEDRLVGATLGHALIIRQPTASLPPDKPDGTPLSFLDVDKVTTENLRAIVKSGVDAAERAMSAGGIYAIYDETSAGDVIAALNGLVRKCERVMLPFEPEDLRFRANIFIAEGQSLRLSFSVGMDGAVDRALTFRNLTTGVTGWVYQTRSPAVCNLQTVGTVVGDTAKTPFHFDPDQQRKIDPEVSWLVSYPVFDPRERQALDVQSVQTDMPTAGLHRLQADHIGPILGILNVDAAWDYGRIGLDPSPDIHSADPRILLLVDCVAQASLRIARLLIAKNERLIDVES